MPDTATTRKTMHVYIGWKVTLPNGNAVHFTDRRESLAYWGEHGREMVLTREDVQCGLERGRSFCGHCKEATYTVQRSE